MRLPIDPMAPISATQLPSGEDWGYQLKWDGVRIIAELLNGQVTLYSRRGLIKNTVYPELVTLLSKIPGRMVLDGEAVVFDPEKQRPNFRLVLQRERIRQPQRVMESARSLPITYVLFDLLESEETDLRGLPYIERYNRLKALFPSKQNCFFVTDLFDVEEPLWCWVEENEWEGVISKRLSSPYRPGKKHKDWYKKKTALIIEPEIVGLTFNEGRIASLIMIHDGLYCGRVSLGLNESLKQQLLSLPIREQSPFTVMPTDLKGVQTRWLENPFSAVITALEMTDYGLLRHPKIIQLRI